MRGTDQLTGSAQITLGIIPAHAGNRCISCWINDLGWDHPRTCGEQLARDCGLISLAGSSPHMRGTGSPIHLAWHSSRIIPAHAGNSGLNRGGGSAWGDHPRTCGEQSVSPASIGGGGGSSPHMRGTGREIEAVGNKKGIIPAHAGNSAGWCIWIPILGDHPRTCGEQSVRTSNVLSASGSSPHMRGTAQVVIFPRKSQ